MKKLGSRTSWADVAYSRSQKKLSTAELILALLASPRSVKAVFMLSTADRSLHTVGVDRSSVFV